MNEERNWRTIFTARGFKEFVLYTVNKWIVPGTSAIVVIRGTLTLIGTGAI